MGKSRSMGVMVAIPSSGRNVPIGWALAMASLSYPVGMNHALFCNVANPENKEMTRDKQRESLAERAIALGAEFIMWIDDDTIPPAHAVQSLWYVLSQNPNAAICGGIYCSKEANPSPLVFKELGAGPFWHWTLGDIFPVAGVATGCMLVRTSVFKTLPKPWFKDFSVAEPGRTELVGEIELPIAGDQGTDDLYFCRKVGEAGHVILAHGGVLPVHVGEDGKQYVLAEDSYPYVSYLHKKAEFEAKGQDPRNREQKVSVVEVKS